MDALLLGLDGASKRFLREHLGANSGAKVRFVSHPLEKDQVPATLRWDVILLDRRTRDYPCLANAIKKNQLEGLKIVLTEKEDLRASIHFWGTAVYSYLLKPVDRDLLRLIWQNALERIQLRKKLSRLNHQREQDRTALSGHQETLQDLFVAHLEMQELIQKKTDFLARTAHELGTPLTAVQGYLELLANGKTGPVNELQLQLLKRSLDSCRRLSRLAGSLMDLSALDGAKAHLQLEPGDIQQNLSRAAAELGQAIKEKGLDLQINYVPGIPAFRFDRDRMHQVFVNLLGNACKFTSAGGSIRIHCAPHFWERRTIREMIYAPQDRRGSTAPADCNSVRVDVKDTGVGISSESLVDIFEPYSREMNGNGSYKGFGLGLAVTRQIVLAHLGKVWAESKPTQGSTFTVLIPTSL